MILQHSLLSLILTSRSRSSHSKEYWPWLVRTKIWQEVPLTVPRALKSSSQVSHKPLKPATNSEFSGRACKRAPKDQLRLTSLTRDTRAGWMLAQVFRSSSLRKSAIYPTPAVGCSIRWNHDGKCGMSTLRCIKIDYEYQKMLQCMIHIMTDCEILWAGELYGVEKYGFA